LPPQLDASSEKHVSNESYPTPPMKKSATTVKSSFYRMCVAIGMAALFSGAHNTAHASQTIRELWDGSGKIPLAGKVTDRSSVGLDNSTTWVVSPPGNTGIQQDGSWNLDDWMGIDGNTVLGDNAGSGGTFAFYGGNMNSLTNPATTLPYGNFYSQCYATRALSSNAYINFKADGTYYFSVRIFRGMSAWGWNADTAGGIGFASSGATNAHFVGAGITRNSPFYAADGITDIGGGCYITTGTLDQAGTGHNTDLSTGLDTDGGPYYPRAAGAAGLFTDQLALLVGKLTTTASGNATMAVKLYPPNTGPYPSDPSTITWDATYSFTETNTMTQLLVWQYGGGTGNQDGLRVGTTWADAIGLELTGAINASPSATIYAGTTVTLSQNAGLNNTTYPMTFQWYSNNVVIVDATNSSLVLTNPTVDFTADYTIMVSNPFGALTNTPVHLTVNPAVKPFFTQQPSSPAKAYVGGTATFTVGVDGTPPFWVQLTHAGTNVPGATAALSSPGTATLKAGPLTIADTSSTFSVVATNAFGSSNSQNVTVTLVIPPAGSFEALALADGATAFWKLSETSNDMTSAGVTLKEYMSGLNGLVPNEPGLSSMSNVLFGLPGPGPILPGFSGITSIKAPINGGKNAQINLPSVTYSNSMTMICWTKISGIGSEGIMFDRNKDSGSAYYGITYYNGSLGSRWGDATSQWNSGITLPINQWVMLALVVEPNETTVYAGLDPFTLQSVTRSSVEGVSYANSSTNLPDGRLVLGRSDYSWAVNDNAWGYMTAQFSDAAIFYQSLTPTAISNLFVAGVGTSPSIVGTPDGAGNVNLDWYPNAGLILQEADSPQGPYTDVLDSSALNVTPPYSESMTNAQRYYRLKK
jgi:hypothetical protein